MTDPAYPPLEVIDAAADQLLRYGTAMVEVRPRGQRGEGGFVLVPASSAALARPGGLRVKFRLGAAEREAVIRDPEAIALITGGALREISMGFAGGELAEIYIPAKPIGRARDE